MARNRTWFHSSYRIQSGISWQIFVLCQNLWRIVFNLLHWFFTTKNLFFRIVSSCILWGVIFAIESGFVMAILKIDLDLFGIFIEGRFYFQHGSKYHFWGFRFTIRGVLKWWTRGNLFFWPLYFESGIILPRTWGHLLVFDLKRLLFDILKQLFPYPNFDIISTSFHIQIFFQSWRLNMQILVTRIEWFFKLWGILYGFELNGRFSSLRLGFYLILRQVFYVFELARIVAKSVTVWRESDRFAGFIPRPGFVGGHSQYTFGRFEFLIIGADIRSKWYLIRH